VDYYGLSRHFEFQIPRINGGESVCLTDIIPVRVRVGRIRVSCINFARALDLYGFGLTPDEVVSLENRCASCMAMVGMAPN
jgi:hypothetical protein